MRNLLNKLILIHIMLITTPYIQSQNCSIQSKEASITHLSLVINDTNRYDSLVNKTASTVNPNPIKLKKENFLETIIGIYDAIYDPWGWLIITCIIITPFIIYKKKFATNKILIYFYICVPILLFYIFQKRFCSEGEVSIPPHIELTMLLLTAILSFMAFYVQYQFNTTQKNDIDDERIENIFFRMYEEHLRLCDSITTQNIGSNKRAFHFMFYELQTLAILLIYYFNIFIKDSIVKDKLKKKALFISFSFILSGVTRKSNDNLKKKIKQLFHNDEEVIKYLGLSSKDSEDSELLKVFNFVECLQVIKNEDLEVFQRKDDLILFIDYASLQLKQNLHIPWFCGHRPELVRYFKSLGNMLNFIRNTEQIRERKKLHRLYDFMFSYMSEHEIGLVFIFTNAFHEFMQLLGLVFDDSYKFETRGEKDSDGIYDVYKQKVKELIYPELNRRISSFNQKKDDDEVSYSYEWDENEENKNKRTSETLNHKKDKHTDEIFKSVAMNWILRTNDIYNYQNESNINYNDQEIIRIVKKIGNTPFSEYSTTKPHLTLVL